MNSPFNTDYSKWVADFQNLQPHEQHHQLENLTDGQLSEFLRHYVMNEKIGVTDICSLPGQFSHLAKFHLVGNQNLSISSQSRVFYVEPTVLGLSKSKDKGVALEEPSRLNVRQFKRITAPVALEAKKAIQAIECFGPLAPEFNRDWLQEITRDEFLLKSATARQDEMRRAYEADEAKRQADLDAAREVLEANGLAVAKAKEEADPLELALKVLEEQGLTLTRHSQKKLEEAKGESPEQADPTTDPES